MTTPEPSAGINRNVFSAGLVSFFMDVSSEMIYPLVPLFLSNVLGVNKAMIGLIEGVAEATASLVKVGSGWLSDRLGRRKGLMLAGYGVSTASRPLLALAGSWLPVFGSRFVDRLGKGIRTAPRDAIIAEATAESHLGRAFSFHRAMDTLGAVVGPALALLMLQMYQQNYRLVFWLSMIPGLLAVFVIIVGIRETARPAGVALPPRRVLARLDGRVRLFLVVTALFSLGNSSDAFLILKAEQSGIPLLMIPAVYLTFNLVYALSAYPAGMAADRFGKKRLILFGFLLFAALYSGFAAAQSATAIWWLFGCYGLFMGLTEGIHKAFLTTIIPPECTATAFGAHAAVVGISALPASLIGGLLWEHVAPAATFYFGSVMSLLAAALFTLLTALSRQDPDYASTT